MTSRTPLSEMTDAELLAERARLKSHSVDMVETQNAMSDGSSYALLDNERVERSDAYREAYSKSSGHLAILAGLFAVVSIPVIVILGILAGR